MSDDAVDYSGTSDSDSESDKVPSRLPARAESCILAQALHFSQAACRAHHWHRLAQCRKANGTKDHPVWASVPIATDPNKYDLGVLLALNPIKVYESIISSGIAGTEYGRLPWLALSVMSGHTSNAASEGCHSIAQLIMSDLQTSMGDDILQMIVCLRDGKEAVEHLKARYPEEANNVALDIKTKLGELALQHQASAQHQHPKPKPDVVVSSSDPSSSGDDSH